MTAPVHECSACGQTRRVYRAERICKTCHTSACRRGMLDDLPTFVVARRGELSARAGAEAAPGLRAPEHGHRPRRFSDLDGMRIECECGWHSCYSTHAAPTKEHTDHLRDVAEGSWRSESDISAAA